MEENSKVLQCPDYMCAVNSLLASSEKGLGCLRGEGFGAC